jgi:hypothetical protein
MIVQSGEATHQSVTELTGTSLPEMPSTPAGLPHQFLLEPGKQITYIDVVVNATAK